MEPAHLQRLDEITAEHTRLLGELASPEVAGDHQRFSEIARQQSELDETVRTYADWRSASEEIDEAREMLREAAGSHGSAEDEGFLKQTIAEAEARVAAAESRLRDLLNPKDPKDERPVIVEIRAGAGGDEAALFGGDLLRMYQRYAEREGWKSDILELSEGSVGGIKEVVYEIKTKGAYSKMRYESGVHRVQRVPATESSGRIHTSTVTVAVLAEADEVDVEVHADDLRIDTYRSQGAGGQHVNTTDSAVRITHLPTNLVVTCQSERSQRQNRERAMRILRSRLKAKYEEEARSEAAAERRSLVGTGDRSEKIRTYNYPQNRITDHRIGYTMHGIQQALDGDIGDLIAALRAADSGELEG